MALKDLTLLYQWVSLSPCDSRLPEETPLSCLLHIEVGRASQDRHEAL